MSLDQSLKKADKELFAKLIRIKGEESEASKGLFFDREVYEINDSKVVVTFSWNGNDQPQIRIVIQNHIVKETLKI